MTGDRDTQPPAPPGRRLRLNPEALRVVPDKQRRFWEQLVAEVELDIANKFRKRWSTVETVRVILADPTETYESVGKELGRSPGAVRYRRMAMVHLLREEAGAPERVKAYIDDPKAHHKQHDYFQVHQAIKELGLYDLPVSEQFDLARPLQQPTASWRGDGTSAALASGSVLLDEVRRLVHELRQASPDDPVG